MAHKKFSCVTDAYGNKHFMVDLYNDNNILHSIIKLVDGTARYRPAHIYYINGILQIEMYYYFGKLQYSISKPHIVIYHSNGKINKIKKNSSFNQNCNVKTNSNIQCITEVVFDLDGNITQQTYRTELVGTKIVCFENE